MLVSTSASISPVSWLSDDDDDTGLRCLQVNNKTDQWLSSNDIAISWVKNDHKHNVYVSVALSLCLAVCLSICC